MKVPEMDGSHYKSCKFRKWSDLTIKVVYLTMEVPGMNGSRYKSCGSHYESSRNERISL